jgi:hypothetical protein
LIGRGGISALHLAARSTEIEKDTKSVYETKRIRKATISFENEQLFIRFFLGTLNYVLFNRCERYQP